MFGVSLRAPPNSLPDNPQPIARRHSTFSGGGRPGAFKNCRRDDSNKKLAYWQ
jgi:hypothetical protein